MIKIEHLKKTYDKGKRHQNAVLHDVSLELPERGFVCILGESGCGKTTLLNAISGLDKFDTGTITTENAVITRSPSAEMERERSNNFGYIFQNYYLLAEHSVAYNVYLGMHTLDLSPSEKMARVKDALTRVDMYRYAKRRVGELSGGQQQRVAIARAIARAPKVIFADEPTGNLDEANTMNICGILKELSQESLVVMVTHEERIARFFADRIISISDGDIVSDSTDWQKGSIDAGEKDTVYAGDYTESIIEGDSLTVRLLHREGAPEARLSIVVEDDRIIIKSTDKRIMLSSSMNDAPYLKEGARPIISAAELTPNEKGEERASAVRPSAPTGKKGIGFKMIWSEAKSLVSGKKLKRFGTGVFIVLLSLFLSIAVSDFITIATVNPEEFITSDSHVINVNMSYGEKLLSSQVAAFKSYKNTYYNYLSQSGLDIEFIPSTNFTPRYYDSTFPQLGSSYVAFKDFEYAPITHLAQEDLIAGRMPEYSNEVVVDRWIIDKALKKDGILQNSIPNAAYFVGKTLVSSNTDYTLKVVGVCDSGNPSIYIGRWGMLAVGTQGADVMPLSEFRAITGYNGLTELADDECIIPSKGYRSQYKTGAGRYFKVVDQPDYGIEGVAVVSDSMLDTLYEEMIPFSNTFKIYAADTDALKAFLAEPLPEELEGKLEVAVTHNYEEAYNEHLEEVKERVRARLIITLTAVIISLIMLYLMQRSKIGDRMDLVAVYRLLGIPKRNLALIFSLESAILSVKYALPTVAAVHIITTVLTRTELIENMITLPLWAALATFAFIALYRLAIAILPLARLLLKPPAVLAAKYDF